MEDSVQNVLPSTSRTFYATRTPRGRGRQQFSLCASGAPAEEDDGISELEVLLHQTWTIFGVSTLFNFHQDEIHLKQYAKRLREEVASKSTQEDVTYTTKFFIMETITLRPSPVDPPPLKIEVYAKRNNTDEDANKCIYNGTLLSWRTLKNELITSNSIKLPLLLCRGTQRTMKTVHDVLSCMFDCRIIALRAQEDDLIWLIPILITPVNKEEYPKSTDEIHMVYKIPEQPDSDTITIKFQIVDLIKILQVIIEDQSNESNAEIAFHLEHIELFREVLYTQMLETAGLQLGLCTLYKINLPAVTIMGNKMKVMKVDAMNRLLLYLNEKALGTFHTLSFES